METESESSTSGDDSVFWLESEVTIQVTDCEEEEREEKFRQRFSCQTLLHNLWIYLWVMFPSTAQSVVVAEARGADVPEIPGDLTLKTCGSTASMKVKHVKKSTTPGLMGCDNIHRLPFTKGHFPKMAECAHFHYENVEFGSIQARGADVPEIPGDLTLKTCGSTASMKVKHVKSEYSFTVGSK
ncbi:PREDICTED: rho GTPase-activating protein 32-like [Rhinopithecus bieti]|uniref:rho GTPase-activating protein 32-like n=1 Tax=Rhinopithecus bieti TaxID=61621 RepID=UPI00083C75D9|nr:PREDICTED: rho GTPase-activating protein 32-like [Rhinopithecus bieti]